MCAEGTRRCGASILSWVKFICLVEVRRSAKCAQCCILASNLSSCVCGVFTKILHCGYLTMQGKIFRVSRWFRQARQLLLTACGRMAKSARYCSPRPSRRFAKRARTMDSQFPRHHCLSPTHLAGDGTALLLFSFLVLLFCTRGSLLDASRLLGLTLRPSAPVCCCHRDSLTRWRLALAQEAVRGPLFSVVHPLAVPGSSSSQ